MPEMKKPTPYQITWMKELDGQVICLQGRHFLYPQGNKWWLHEGGDDCPIGRYLNASSVASAIRNHWITKFTPDSDYTVSENGREAIKEATDA